MGKKPAPGAVRAIPKRQKAVVGRIHVVPLGDWHS
jgi:hypothetical protein